MTTLARCYESAHCPQRGAQLSFYDAKEERKQMRHYYFGHLTDVVMVDSNMLAAAAGRR